MEPIRRRYRRVTFFALRGQNRSKSRGDVMELHEIRYFLVLSKTLNFTKVAEACNVSQPALTRAI